MSPEGRISSPYGKNSSVLSQVTYSFSVLLKVPQCPQKEELAVHMERIPACCHKLHSNLKSTTYGKSATFNKVGLLSFKCIQIVVMELLIRPQLQHVL